MKYYTLRRGALPFKFKKRLYRVGEPIAENDPVLAALGGSAVPYLGLLPTAAVPAPAPPRPPVTVDDGAIVVDEVRHSGGVLRTIRPPDSEEDE